MAKIPKRVAERLSKTLGRFQKVLADAKDRDVNEADTVTIVTDLLAEVFGYDKYADVTSEQAIRGTYCDLAVKQNGQLKFLIEVKAIGLTLRENHLRQAVNYGPTRESRGSCSAMGSAGSSTASASSSPSATTRCVRSMSST